MSKRKTTDATYPLPLTLAGGLRWKTETTFHNYWRVKSSFKLSPHLSPEIDSKESIPPTWRTGIVKWGCPTDPPGWKTIPLGSLKGLQIKSLVWMESTFPWNSLNGYSLKWRCLLIGLTKISLTKFGFDHLSTEWDKPYTICPFPMKDFPRSTVRWTRGEFLKYWRKGGGNLPFWKTYFSPMFLKNGRKGTFSLMRRYDHEREISDAGR